MSLRTANLVKLLLITLFTLHLAVMEVAIWAYDESDGRWFWQAICAGALIVSLAILASQFWDWYDCGPEKASRSALRVLRLIVWTTPIYYVAVGASVYLPLVYGLWSTVSILTMFSLGGLAFLYGTLIGRPLDN